MKQLRVLRMRFAEPIESHEISAFRGAVIQLVERDRILFHNHDGNRYRYAYPLIQYKRVQGKPMIVGIDNAIEDLPSIFQEGARTVQLNGRPYRLAVDDIDVHQFNVSTWDKQFSYRLRNWIALKPENFRQFQSLPSADCDRYLSRILTGNILSFAKGIGWWVDGRINIDIQNINEGHMVRFKDLPMLAFQVEFRTNVFLPNYIGLGKGVSRGFGVLHSLQRQEDVKAVRLEIQIDE